MLAAQDPVALELRALGSVERSLRELLTYVEQVATILDTSADTAAARTLTLPTVPELAELADTDPLLIRVQALVRETEDLQQAVIAHATATE
ncbi:MAG: hypothetical protein EA356_05570 [Geminicoccaceae bacterium]|nr:MAG: hypothetical protein EA356_05570 [Geminicoccaceae bacterium]